MGGAPIGGIMGGIIPGGMGAMLGGLWPMGGIPIGGKWGGIPGGPIFGKHKNKFEAWMSANTTKQPQRERDGITVKAFQHQLTKGGGIPEGGTPGKGGAWLGPLLASVEDCYEQESPLQ